MKPQIFTLPANETQRKSVPGNFIRADKATGPIRIKIDGLVDVTLERGQQVTLPEFTGFEVSDLSGSVNAVTLIIGYGGFDNGQISGDVSVNVPESLNAVDNVIVNAVGQTLVLPYHANRAAFIIKASKNNTADVTIGGNNTILPGQGITLEPGQSLREASKSAIWAAAAPVGQVLEVIYTD